MECDSRVLYDNEGPVNRWENTFYNHREHTAPIAQFWWCVVDRYICQREEIGHTGFLHLCRKIFPGIDEKQQIVIIYWLATGHLARLVFIVGYKRGVYIGVVGRTSCVPITWKCQQVAQHRRSTRLLLGAAGEFLWNFGNPNSILWLQVGRVVSSNSLQIDWICSKYTAKNSSPFSPYDKGIYPGKFCYSKLCICTKLHQLICNATWTFSSIY